MKLDVGDSVVVKSGAVDPDLIVDIAGWQGRIVQVDYGGTVLIRWDSITLRRMSKKLVVRCENENLDWEVMTLNMIDIDKTLARDSDADVSRVANQLRVELIGDPRLNAGP